MTRIDSSHCSTVDSSKSACVGCHRVVHEHVEPAEVFDGRVDEGGDVFRDADVATDGDRGAASAIAGVVIDRGDGLVDGARNSTRMRGDAARRADDVGAEAGQPDRQAFADAA